MKQTLYQESHPNQPSLRSLGRGYKNNYNNGSDQIIYQNQYSKQTDTEYRTAKFHVENNLLSKRLQYEVFLTSIEFYW